MIISVSEQFHTSTDPVPDLHDLDEFGLSGHGATGKELPLKGHVEPSSEVIKKIHAQIHKHDILNAHKYKNIKKFSFLHAEPFSAYFQGLLHKKT